MTDDEAIAHLTSRGWLVLPREPTQAVCQAIGRAWASMDGKSVEFATDVDRRDAYLSEAEELWRRAWRV